MTMDILHQSRKSGLMPPLTPRNNQSPLFGQPLRTLRSRLRLPFSPEPTSLTTSVGLWPLRVAHSVSLPTCLSRSSLWSADETRAYSTQPPRGSAGTTTKCLPVGRVSMTGSGGSLPCLCRREVVALSNPYSASGADRTPPPHSLFKPVQVPESLHSLPNLPN